MSFLIQEDDVLYNLGAVTSFAFLETEIILDFGTDIKNQDKEKASILTIPTESDNGKKVLRFIRDNLYVI